MGELYDVIIIGAGPAGLTAGIYCAQAGLKTLVLEKETIGGQTLNIEKIENYPGFAEGVLGAELGQMMAMQAMNYGVGLNVSEVIGLELDSKNKRVKTVDSDYLGKSVIIASGGCPMRLGVRGEEEFIGRGVAYCAICEGSQFKGKVVAVAGGGDAGVTEALYLTQIASRVLIVEVMPQLNAKAILQKRAFENKKIEIMCSTRIEAILGDSKVQAIQVLNTEKGGGTTLNVDGVLVHVGWEPQTKYLEGVVPLDNERCIVVDEKMETGLSGVFAAGDIRRGSLRQVATAIGDGTTAAIMAQKYLREVF